MKKLFTLIAAALFAVSASAKEAIDVSSLYSEGTTINFDAAWQWKGITMSTGSLVEDKDAKTADDTGVTYYDASAFDYIVVKYSASTADVNLIAQYNCKGTIGQYGAEYNQGQITIDKSATGGIIGLALDATYKKTINAIALQNGNATGTLTIEEIYFATTAEWEAVKPAPPTTKEIDFTSFSGYVAADKNFVFEAGKAGWYSKWIGTLDPDYFKYLVVEVASSTGDVQLVIQGTKTEGATPADNLMITKTESAKTFYADIEGWSNISQFAFQNFNFSDPENEDWDAKQASAMETTMVITAMYLSKDKPAVDEGGEEATTYILDLNSIYDKAKAGTDGAALNSGSKYNMNDYSPVQDIFTIVSKSGRTYRIDLYNPDKPEETADYKDYVASTRLEPNGTSNSTGGRQMFVEVAKKGKLYIGAWGNADRSFMVVPAKDKTTYYNVSDKTKTDSYIAEENRKLTHKFSADDAKTAVYDVELEPGLYCITQDAGIYFAYVKFVEGGSSTGINNVKLVKPVIITDAIYNLAGQRVNENYKGIVIKNGKKFIQK